MLTARLLIGFVYILFVHYTLLIPVLAAEIKAGTTVNSENLDQLLDKTFDGTPLTQLIPESFQWQIREKGLTMKLTNPKPHPIDPVLRKASEKNRSTVSLDLETRRVVGWKAGVPFPDVKPNDAHAGLKVIWNLYYGKPRGDSQVFPNGIAVLISEKTGIEGMSLQNLTRVFLKGLLRRKGAPTLGSGKIQDKNILVMKAPASYEGSGLLFYRYDTGQTDYLLIYMKDANKVVKWSGEFWMDQVGETDYLGDDLFIFSAYPTWYDGYQVIGKKKILVIANTENPFVKLEEAEWDKRFPAFDMKNKPYWNPIDRWEPREVFVVEATAPDLHPYSRKILYIDAKTWLPYLSENYTKKGALWKTAIQGYRAFPIKKEPKGTIIWPPWAQIVDFQKNHATILATDDKLRFNDEIDPKWLNLDTLKGGNVDVEIDVPWNELNPEQEKSWME